MQTKALSSGAPGRARLRGKVTTKTDAARWADGRYAAIDQNRGTVAINTPYDKELVALGARYNLPVIDDIGSGALVDLRKYGLKKEPSSNKW